MDGKRRNSAKTISDKIYKILMNSRRPWYDISCMSISFFLQLSVADFVGYQNKLTASIYQF